MTGSIKVLSAIRALLGMSVQRGRHRDLEFPLLSLKSVWTAVIQLNKPGSISGVAVTRGYLHHGFGVSSVASHSHTICDLVMIRCPLDWLTSLSNQLHITSYFPVGISQWSQLVWVSRRENVGANSTDFSVHVSGKKSYIGSTLGNYRHGRNGTITLERAELQTHDSFFKLAIETVYSIYSSQFCMRSF